MNNNNNVQYSSLTFSFVIVHNVYIGESTDHKAFGGHHDSRSTKIDALGARCGVSILR